MSYFLKDVIKGLHAKPKRANSKYFYDPEGDALFQKIMNSEDYYLTRSELEIFKYQTQALAQSIIVNSDDFDLIELGAGDATKSKFLLKFLIDNKVSFTYF